MFQHRPLHIIREWSIHYALPCYRPFLAFTLLIMDFTNTFDSLIFNPFINGIRCFSFPLTFFLLHKASSSAQSLYSVPPAPDSFCRFIDFITDLTEGFSLHFHFGDNCVLCRCVMVSSDNFAFRLALDVLTL